MFSRGSRTSVSPPQDAIFDHFSWSTTPDHQVVPLHAKLGYLLSLCEDDERQQGQWKGLVYLNHYYKHATFKRSDCSKTINHV